MGIKKSDHQQTSFEESLQAVAPTVEKVAAQGLQATGNLMTSSLVL